MNSAGDAASSHPVAEGYVRRATKELGVKQEEKMGIASLP